MQEQFKSIVFDVMGKMMSNAGTEEIVAYLSSRYPMDKLVELSNRDELANAIPTIPEPYRGNLLKIIDAFKEKKQNA